MAKLRVGIVGVGGRGAGSFGKNFLDAHADSTEIVGVADNNPLRAKAGIEGLGINVPVFEDAEELCQLKGLDAVVITTPDCMHEEHALAALKNKKHVLVDKPLATTVEGCIKILEKAREVRRLVYMGFNLRHNVVVRNLKRMATEGRMGDIFSLQAIEHYNGGRTYHARWNRLKKFSGGLWLHKGSHDFDVINHIMGAVRPARVSCFASVSVFRPDRLPFPMRKGVEPGPTCNLCPYNTECKDANVIIESDGVSRSSMFNEQTAQVDGYYKNQCMYLSDKDTHDQGVAIIEYENGATATHTECFATPISNRRYFIDGTGGHVEADLRGHRVEFWPRWSKDQVSHKVAPEEGGHGGADPIMIQDFLDCIRSRKRPLADAADGVWSVAVAVAAEKSREENRVVEIADLMDVDSPLLQRRG